ncbi:MAG: bifunctional DNA primase/polymerase [Streptosporangiaceae bacterium]
MVDVMLRRARRKERTAREQMASAARRYAALGWPVCQGVYPAGGPSGALASGRACSCDRIGCPAPGAHPVSPGWQHQATSELTGVSQIWAAAPEANVILATGRAFDVLDIPVAAGLAALDEIERAGIQPGPVAVSAGERVLFFVASRAAHTTQDEWWSCHLDCVPDDMDEADGLRWPTGLRWHCRGSYVLAPPSRYGPSRNGTVQAARWIRAPEGRPLPDAVRLLEHLAEGEGS